MGNTINSNMRCKANDIFRYMFFFLFIKWNQNKNVKYIHNYN